MLKHKTEQDAEAAIDLFKEEVIQLARKYKVYLVGSCAANCSKNEGITTGITAGVRDLKQFKEQVTITAMLFSHQKKFIDKFEEKFIKLS